jgi:AraC-like DNA-binding protein
MDRIHPPRVIAAVVNVLEEDGIAASDVLAGSGLAREQLRQPDTCVSYRQMEAVIRNALHLSKDPAIALRCGQRMHVNAFGMYGYAMLSSPSYAHGIDIVVRYSRLIGSVVDIGFSRDADVATCTYDLLLSRNPADDVYRFAIEFTCAAQLTLSRDLYGDAFGFLRLNFMHAAPAHADAYARAFACPVAFDQRANAVQIDAAWIDRPILADSGAQAFAHALGEQLLGRVGPGGGLAADIRRLLVTRPGRFPGIDAMAQELSLHPRTLRRRLDAERMTYRHLLAEVRMRLAIEYLGKTRMTNEEISSRLGYSDVANFRHAFNRWTGRSPSDFRERMRTGGEAAAVGLMRFA